MASYTEQKWRVRILHLDGKLDNMSRFCEMDDNPIHDCDCSEGSFICYTTNNPETRVCQRCLCGVCIRSDAQCKKNSQISPPLETKRKW
jgi:hypothetical protein